MPHRRAGRWRRATSCAGRCPGRLASTVRAGEIVGLAGLVGLRPQRIRAVRVRRHAGRVGRRSGMMGKAVRIRSTAARRATRVGLRAGGPRRAGPRPADERRCTISRSRAARASRASASSTAPPSGGWPTRRSQRFSVKTSSPDEIAGRALGRQPAEDRARQVARQQSQAADPRRADARHRRRRQGGNPSPDGRTRRPGRRRS